MQKPCFFQMHCLVLCQQPSVDLGTRLCSCSSGKLPCSLGARSHAQFKLPRRHCWSFYAFKCISSASASLQQQLQAPPKRVPLPLLPGPASLQRHFWLCPLLWQQLFLLAFDAAFALNRGHPLIKTAVDHVQIILIQAIAAP